METRTPPPGFTVCPCGALVQAWVWVHGTTATPPQRRQLDTNVTPALGVPHTCPETP
jgi:hypothetical protein